MSADCFGFDRRRVLYFTVLTGAVCYRCARHGGASQTAIWTNDPVRSVHTHSAALLDRICKFILFLTNPFSRYMSVHCLNRSFYSIPVLTVQLS